MPAEPVRPDGVTSYSLIQLASHSSNAVAMVLFLFDLLYLDRADLLPRPHRQDHRRRTIGPATEKLPSSAMWFPRRAPPARRGTDPERDERFESGSLQR